MNLKPKDQTVGTRSNLVFRQRSVANMVAAAILALFVTLLPARAAVTRTWVCNWANNNWGTSTNWSPAGVPQNGDDLVFASGYRFDSVNNLAAFKARAITIANGAQISGNGFTVSNSIVWTAGSLSDVFAPVTLGGNLTFSAATANVRMVDINLNGFDLTLDFGNNIEINGSISGTGDVTKNGAGRLLLGGAGDNSFNGTFYHYGGELWAAKSPSFPGHFFSSGHTIVYNGGAFSPNHDIVLLTGALLECDFEITNTCANLVMVGARIEAFPMTLGVRTNLIVQASTTVSEVITHLDLGNTGHVFQIANGVADPDLKLTASSLLGGASAGFTKTGTGTIRLVQTGGTYGGNTVISNGMVELYDIGNSLGNNVGKTIVHSNANLRILGPGGLDESLELHGTGINGTNGALHAVNGFLTFHGSITVPAGATIRSDATLHAHSVLAGAGDIRFSGAGEFWNHGAANTLTGDIIVESGVFVLDKGNGVSVNPNSTIQVGTNGIFGGGAIATLLNYASNQVTGPVIIRSGSRWEIGSGAFEGAPDVTMLGNAEILADGGTFQLDGTLTVQPQIGGSTARIYGGNVSFGSGATRTINIQDIGGSPDNIELLINPGSLAGSAPVVKTGSGDLRLSGQYGFTSPIIVDAGDLRVTSIAPLGSGSGGTIVTNTGRLILEGSTFDQEPLTIKGGGSPETGNVYIDSSSSWRAPITLNAPLRAYPDAGQTWTVNAPISGIGAFLVTGPGLVVFDWDTVNSYTGGTWVKDGELRLNRVGTNVSIPGDLTIGDGTGAAGSARVAESAFSSQIADTSDVYIYPDGRLIITNQPGVEIIRTLNGSGEVIVSNATLRLNDSGNESTWSGTIRGNGDFIKAGSGTLTLDGSCFLNGGLVSMFGGTMLVNGLFDGAPNPTLIDAWSGTVLGGTGTVEDVRVRSGAVLSPGNSPGKFTASTVTLDSGANLFLELRGDQPGVSHDQLVVKTDLNCTNAVLTLSVNFPPTEGQVFRLVDNQGANPIHGIFSGKPEGTLINISGNQFALSYVGGSGNDLTLTATNMELGLLSAVIPNGNGLVDSGECNELVVVLTNKSGGSLSSVTATLDSLSPAIAVSQQNAAFANFTANSTRTNLTPFRISSLPGFACGQLVELRLTVTVPGAGTFSMPIKLTTGLPASTATFNSSGTTAIPDLATTNSTINVASFPAYVSKVVVSFQITHTFDADLEISLQSPSGKLVKLVADRGSSGDNFGTNCSPSSSRTTFDDSSRNDIALATAPFVGTYSPEEPLTNLKGEWGNGAWKLVITDDAGGDTGTLNCWTLTLYYAACAADGGSSCSPCVSQAAGTLNAQSPTMTQRMFRDANPAICSESKTCPGASTAIGSFRYGTHTFTNTGASGCMTVVLRDHCGNSSLFASAYLGAFDSADLCAGYLADIGTNALAPSMSFYAYSNTVFTVVVNELAAGVACSSYHLEIFGLPCPPPRVQVAPAAAGKVRLFWNALGGDGFDLQSAPVVTGAFTNVGIAPAFLNGTLNVTNVANPNMKFFRLKKP